MAKTVAPLLSFDAGGQIAKTQVYSRWKGRPYVRRYVVPANPNTAAQQETRSTFAWLQNVWKFFPAGATGAWELYANGFRITGRNAFAKVNLPPLRGKTDLSDFVFSPSASAGIVATGVTVTPGTESLQVTVGAPVLPTGWTITSAWAAAIAQQDPSSGALYQVTAGSDESTPYEITLTGLEAAQEYVVGAWFEYKKPDGSPAYGQSLMTTGTPTA